MRIEYQKISPSVNINYQSIGSGGGVKQFTERTVDFGASDATLTENETQTLSAPAAHIPETIGSGATASIYNIIGIPDSIYEGVKLQDRPVLPQTLFPYLPSTLPLF
jgi:phosphate transport system substrate-binding protein